MTLELKVPQVGESITEVEIGEWFKKQGEMVQKDENVVALESEKASVELPAPSSGTLVQILKNAGEKAAVGEVIGFIDPAASLAEKAEPAPSEPEPARAEPAPARTEPARESARESARSRAAVAKARVTPPAERVKAPESREETAALPGREEEVVPMTALRRTVSERLVEARQEMAMVTTFNEIDMTAAQALRKQFQEQFTARHGVKLGLMSFFVKAVIEGLKRLPQLNASVRGGDIVYHNYFDIAVAVSSDKGLVVPALRNAERMSFAEIEKTIADLSKRAQDNKLKPAELQGGTFTLTNGGVFGSLLSTPIINPPQSGILGMHGIQERPVVISGAIVARPMMYVALSYDHRIVDGREAVQFLRHIKELIESPALVLLEL